MDEVQCTDEFWRTDPRRERLLTLRYLIHPTEILVIVPNFAAEFQRGVNRSTK